MSWLARSLANSLVADEGRADRDDGGASTSGSGDNRLASTAESDEDPNRGVKEDLSEISQTLTRQFWGVASFLAPQPSISSDLDLQSVPPASDQPNREEAADVPESPSMSGIRSDFAEIGGRFRSGISKLSNNASIGKIASNFIPFRTEEKLDEDEEEEEEVNAIGVYEEVLVFAMNIAMHPETWLDFPLFDEFEEDSNDFEMSDAQQEHALAVESLLPRLAALRIELCPTHMSEGCFWKIYFVLLHSRLNRHDAELLSTPQIAKARAMLLQKLQYRTKPDYKTISRDQPGRSVDATFLSPRSHVSSPVGINPATSAANLYLPDSPTAMPSTYWEADKLTAPTEIEIIDRPIIEEQRAIQPRNKDLVSNFSEITIRDYADDDDGDEWLEEEAAGLSASMSMPYGSQEDVSFSDLEDDDEPMAPSGSKNAPSGVKTSAASALSSNTSDR